MRTSWPTSRAVAPAGRAWFLAGLVLGLVLWLSGCGAGGGGESATRPSTERSGTPTAPSVSELPSVTATAPTRPPRTTAATPTSDQPPTTVEPPTSRTSAVTSTRTSTSVEPTSSPTNAPATSAAGTPASAESQGLGALGWALLILLVVGVIAAWMIWRSRRRSAWDAEAGALEQDTRTVTNTQLPSVLTAETAGQRALSWPPLRAGLIDLMRRWDLLAQRASDDRRRDRSTRIRGLLQELVAAVDAENEALATGRDWRLLRPRVDQAGQALSAVLAGGPQQQPPPGGDPGRPGPGG